MSERSWDRVTGAVWLGAGVAGLLTLIAGCHAKPQGGENSFLQRISSAVHSNSTASAASKMAAQGGAAITQECVKQSYENARKGLIVSETGLHEDVFALRDRNSYATIAFGLDDALRLEALLQAELKAGTQSPEEERCVRDFEEHLETLTDPMVYQDRVAKDLDTSAFNDAAKQAQDQLEKQRARDTLPAVGKVP